MLKELYAKFHKRGLVIVGVSIDDDREKFEQALKNTDLPWTHVFQGTTGPLVKLFNARAIPVSFLIDAHGRIAAKIMDKAQLQQQITKLMEK